VVARTKGLLNCVSQRLLLVGFAGDVHQRGGQGDDVEIEVQMWGCCHVATVAA
jgi:hypothetical protein